MLFSVGIKPVFQAAPAGVLPLCLRWEPLVGPGAVGDGVGPGHVDNGVVQSRQKTVSRR